MKKLLTAAMLSTLAAGISARAADAPATQPTPPPGAAKLDAGAHWHTSKTFVFGGQPGTVQAFNLGTNFVGHTEKAAWLGLSTSHPDAVLLKQLKIKSGLVVDVVEPASPAEGAGLKAQDIIEKLDDQILVNPAQLEELVRLHNPGDSVTLTLLHEGTRTTATAKLIEHDVMVMPDGGPQVRVADVLKDLGAPNGVAAAGNLLPNGALGTQTHMEFKINGDGLTTGFESQYSDGTHALTIALRDKQKILTIKDLAGKVLFEGPIDTKEQQDKIPAELQSKFQEMQQMSKMTEEHLNP